MEVRSKGEGGGEGGGMQRIACALLSHAPYVDVPACACRYWPGSTASIDRSTFDDAIHTIVVRALSRMKTYTERGMSAPSSYSHGPGARQRLMLRSV